jgi:hypothetical protein
MRTHIKSWISRALINTISQVFRYWTKPRYLHFRVGTVSNVSSHILSVTLCARCQDPMIECHTKLRITIPISAAHKYPAEVIQIFGARCKEACFLLLVTPQMHNHNRIP